MNEIGDKGHLPTLLLNCHVFKNMRGPAYNFHSTMAFFERCITERKHHLMNFNFNVFFINFSRALNIKICLGTKSTWTGLGNFYNYFTI